MTGSAWYLEPLVLPHLRGNACRDDRSPDLRASANGQWDIPALRQLLERSLPHDSSFEDYIVEHDFPEIGHVRMSLSGRRVVGTRSGTRLILLAIDPQLSALHWRRSIRAISPTAVHRKPHPLVIAAQAGIRTTPALAAHPSPPLRVQARNRRIPGVKSECRLTPHWIGACAATTGWRAGAGCPLRCRCAGLGREWFFAFATRPGAASPKAVHRKLHRSSFRRRPESRTHDGSPLRQWTCIAMAGERRVLLYLAPATGHDEASPEGQRRCHAESQARQVSGDSTTRFYDRCVSPHSRRHRRCSASRRAASRDHRCAPAEACANAKLHPLPFELHRGGGLLQAVGDAPLNLREQPRRISANSSPPIMADHILRRSR